VSVTRKRQTGFQTTSLEAKLIPALNHARSVFQVMVFEVVEAELECSFCCRDGIWVVPLLVGGHSIPQVNCLEEGVVVFEEGPAGHVEFVGELCRC
jgi:hypothetical protein